jgi:RNA polymerase-binding transcription factor DksA
MSSPHAPILPEEADDRRGDEADQSQVMERLFLAASLAAVGGMSHIPGRTQTTCIDCEEEIDPRRLRAIDGPLRCVGCQDEYDRNSHLS